MKEPMFSFGYWLRRRRKALDLTQEALAGMAACSRFAIRKIEADERRPSRRLAERLAEKLAIPAEEREAFLAAARSIRAAAALSLNAARSDRAAAMVVAPAQRTLAAPPAAEAPPLVGRAAEWARLGRLCDLAAGGNGQAILLAGEPGIGKSRLMAELQRRCRAAGSPVLAARCYEIERAMPYQPVIDVAAQALGCATDQALQKLQPVAIAEIAALVPSLHERVPVAALSADFPEARKSRLFTALVQLLITLPGTRPATVTIDDIQWADDASLEFIHYLARQAAARPLLVVAAYRSEELDLQERLALLVESLRREAHVSILPLARLQVEDTRALIEGLAHSAFRLPGLAERLQRETDGNPFFITSMLHALADGEIEPSPTGALPLPEALRAAVRSRVGHLSAAARAVLDAAAVLGRRFDFETLESIVPQNGAALLAALEELVKRRLLREEAEDGFYDFSHDKVREVVYAGIGGARRVTLHRAVAAALESAPREDPRERDAQLAEHYERGHSWEKALRYQLLAAERSQRLFAMRDALQWLDRAVALAETHPEVAGDALRLYEQRGVARVQAGQTGEAVADIRKVIDAARSRRDRGKARDALIQLGMAYRRADDYTQATRCLEEALAESRAMQDDHSAADTLYHLGTVAWSDNRNREAIGHHRQAVELCERLGLQDLVAVQAWHGRGEAHFNNLEPREAIACYQRSIKLARSIGDRSYESENLMMVGFACTGYMGLADYVRAEANFEAALDIARRADLQWHLGPTLLGLDHLHGCLGRSAEALDGMTRTLRWLESLKQVRYQIMAHDLLGHLLLELGRQAEAAAHFERGLALGETTRIMFWRPRLQANLAIARLRLGDLESDAALENAAAHCRQNSEGFQLARCLEGLAELWLARGDAPRSLAHAEELIGLVEQAGLRELALQARRWRGAALLRMGQVKDGEEALRRVIAEADAMGRAVIAEACRGMLEHQDSLRW